ncbi:hypothetical protein [Ruegeria sp. HKCCD7255]|uniref:hypothetical protein n=1 Tax=Ruegeria sp. HKCCD7255 TaxID=2683004 RepID=UPI001488F4AA|nr:hypothetical protein [Ruegeria sp. HKCCD7255]
MNSILKMWEVLTVEVAILSSVAFTDEGRLFELARANTNLMAEHNCLYFGGRKYRTVFKPALDAPKARPVASETSALFQTQIPEGQEPRRVILTGGSFLGSLTSTIENGQFYPSAGERLSFISHVFDGQPIQLFIALRNPASVIAGVLAALPQQDRQQILSSTDLSCLSWLPMIEDIQELAPNIEITLWSDTHAPLIIGKVFRALAGLPEDAPLTNEFAFLSSLLADAGVRELDELLSQEDFYQSSATRDALAEIFERHAHAEAIEEVIDYPGWDDEVVAAFTELYEQDLAQLQTMPGIRFLTP